MRNTKSSLSRADAGGDQKQDYHLEWPNWGARFDDRAFHIFRNGWIDCKDAFHAVLFL